MLSRDLATSLGVNIASGMRASSAGDVRVFAKGIGYPVIIKALDGGGGRGIRVVEAESDVEEAFRRCVFSYWTLKYRNQNLCNFSDASEKVLLNNCS